MFKVLSGETKRRVISPATITASVAAHVLLLGGVVYAAGGEGTSTGQMRADTTIVWQADDPPPPEPKVQQPAPPPPPQQPDDSAPPKTGETLEVPDVTEPPDGIQPEDPGAKPVDLKDYTGQGPVGTVIGPPQPDPPADPGPGEGGRGGVTDMVLDASMVEEQPVLDRNGLSRALERNYPSVLRDSRVGGRVVIELIVDENGRPEPGSARVVETSHPAFGEATLRAVERFRFRPAKLMGTAVPVRVTIPIVWTAR